ncbi:hypothetical protein DMN91_004317 [Ooceraea biroi]|uniref:Troponin I n=1 Tax=Ooceraea biroi TaxID=2015173 RepID=A0A3L8DWF4_OOCBI|nr:hypothetical protein DMN91_004317 [Ooceraea biroi]
MADDEEKKRKQAETERKRAEVRARLEEASKAKKAKKGFMTPDRKKKLRRRVINISRVFSVSSYFHLNYTNVVPLEIDSSVNCVNISGKALLARLRNVFLPTEPKFTDSLLVCHQLLLRKKAAEELKKEQERKAAERRRIIEERCGKPKNVDDANEENVKRVLREYHSRIAALEDKKFDIEYIVKKKDFEIADLNSQVNDLRGKFMKPTLKKVSKYENKFAKLQKKAAEFNFRNQLKQVKKKEFTLEEEDKEKKPDWSKKGDEKKVKEEEPVEA